LRENTPIHEDALFETLRLAVTSACDIVAGAAVPTRERRVMWMKPEETGRPELSIRKASIPSAGALPQETRTRIFSDARVASFLNIVEPLRTEQYRVNALEMYFNTLGRFAWEPALGQQFCRWILELANPPARIAMVGALLVQSFSACEAYTLDEAMVLRPARDTDIDEYGEDHALLRRRPVIGPSDWICTIGLHEAAGQESSCAAYRALMEDLLNAFALVSAGSAAFQLFRYRPTNLFLDRPILSNDPLRRSTGSKTGVMLSQPDIALLQDTFAAIRRVRAESRFADLALPLRRLRSGVGRSSGEDQLVDYVVALERLLAADANTEISFRFRLRGAALLPEAFGNLRERMRLMQQLYNLRSAVVHGSAKASDLSSLLPHAENALKAIMLWYLRRLDGYKDIRTTLQELDLALVVGGEGWASP
jgi:hypothetical protein